MNKHIQADINFPNYEIRSLTHFLMTKNAAEIHEQICEIYGPDAMNDIIIPSIQGQMLERVG